MVKIIKRRRRSYTEYYYLELRINIALNFLAARLEYYLIEGPETNLKTQISYKDLYRFSKYRGFSRSIDTSFKKHLYITKQTE